MSFRGSVGERPKPKYIHPRADGYYMRPTTMLVRYNYLYFAGKWLIEHKIFTSMISHCKKLSNLSILAWF